jgi:hypothetical protein
VALRPSRSARSSLTAVPSSESTGPMSPVTRTCEPSQPSGLEQSTPSAAASHARTYPQPEKALASKASEAGYGESLRDSLANYDRASRSWRTSAPSLFGGLDTFSETWPKWGWMRSGSAFRLVPLAHLSGENVSGLLPTPTASDADTHHSDTIRFDSLSVFLRRTFGYPSYPNPRFVEWMMGFPIEWTALEPSETPSSRRSPKSSVAQSSRQKEG